MGLNKILNRPKEFRYQLLDRLKQDCVSSSFLRDLDETKLWALNFEDQIHYMKEIWLSFDKEEKPEWLSMDEIISLENKIREKLDNKLKTK